MRPAYPRSLHEFRKLFADEAACRDYLARSRWPDGFRCPSCGHDAALVLLTRLLWRCRGCRRETSVTAGTVLHRTRIPLTQWFWAAYLVATQTPGFSALQLQRQLGIGRYETAWAMLQKLRRAMVRPDREPLQDRVEIDETYIGGPEAGLRGGREVGEKAIVVGAVEARGKASGRVRLQVVPDVSARSLTSFVRANVARGAVLLTDGWGSYASLSELGYRHRSRVQGDRRRGSKILPRIHRVFGNLKTWLRGTHHGVGHAHLQAYLDEFTFRFNRRRTPMAAFQTLLGLGSQQPPTTYKQLYGVELNG